MRKWLNILNEAYWNTLDVTTDYGAKHIVEVFKNPNRLEFHKLLRQSSEGSLRATLYGNDLLVWEGTSVQHHDLDHAIQEQISSFGKAGGYYIRLFLDASGVSMHASPDEKTFEEEEKFVQNSRALQRIYGKDFEVTYP